MNGIFDPLAELVSRNLYKIIFSVLAAAIIYIIYRLLARQIAKLMEQKKLEEDIAFTLKRVLQGLAVLSILAVIFAQFGVEVGLLAGLLTLAGSTIIGFAAMNTLGNAIAGIIVMISRPFKVGDRICFQGQFADVIDVDLIYTRMKTLDNVLISVPNQELLKSPIDNYEKRRVVRRSCSITAGYELGFEQVEKALLEAASDVRGVLEAPKPYVWITRFGNFAVEYTLYAFTNQIRRLPEIEAGLKRTVLETCKKHKIDISTPTLIQRAESSSNEVTIA